MKKKIFLTVFVLGSFLSVYAGGLLTNTNQNVAFLRNPARGASVEIDAAYTNPAGLAFLKREGFYLSLNNQSAFQTRTITTTYAPFAGFGGDATKAFKGEAQVLVVPNIQAAYKKGDHWVFSANIGVTGGGGTLNFKQGLPSFESTVAITPVFLDLLLPLDMRGYDLESRMKGSSVVYGAQFGATYQLHEQYSVYAGFRFSYANNGYDGYLKNVRLGVAGNMVSATSFINDPQLPPTLKPSVSDLIGDKALDCKQTGSGIAPIIGFHYNWDELHIGAKYEFKTSLSLKNKTTTNTTKIADYDDGATTPYDIPALLAVGLSYDITPELVFSAGYHHFFDSNAKMAKNKQQFINNGLSEYLAGVEYRINDRFLVSCGTQFTRTGVTDDYQTDLSFSLNSYSIGFGGAINLTHRIRLNLAYFFTNYENWNKTVADYGNFNSISQAIPVTTGTDIYGRTNKAFGIGLDFRF